MRLRAEKILVEVKTVMRDVNPLYFLKYNFYEQLRQTSLRTEHHEDVIKLFCRPKTRDFTEFFLVKKV